MPRGTRTTDTSDGATEAQSRARLAALEREMDALKAAAEPHPRADFIGIEPPRPNSDERARLEREQAKTCAANESAEAEAERARLQAERDASLRAVLDGHLRAVAEQAAAEHAAHAERIAALATAEQDLRQAMGQLELRARAAGREQPLPPAPRVPASASAIKTTKGPRP
jgi:hypothetical protein